MTGAERQVSGFRCKVGDKREEVRLFGRPMGAQKANCIGRTEDWEQAWNQQVKPASESDRMSRFREFSRGARTHESEVRRQKVKIKNQQAANFHSPIFVFPVSISAFRFSSF